MRNTVLFVVSDHGEEFYEHGSRGHGTLPYEEVLRVPLIVTGAGIGSGVRRRSPVHHLDLMPTILEVAGIPAPEQLRGRSFAALLAERAVERAVEHEPIFSAAWSLPEGLQRPALTVRLGYQKLIRYDEGSVRRFEHFDLSEDPREQRNIFEADSEQSRNLVGLLESYEAEMSALREDREVEGAPAQGLPPAVDPAREEKLRALGYIE
jgi:arylsulfatase A-like enzyme